MGLIEDLLCGKNLLQIERPYWAVKLDSGRWLSEAMHRIELARMTDWTNDLVANDDVSHVRELWMLCPANRHSPLGNTVRVPILRPGTAFQFKAGTFDTNLVVGHKTMQAMIVGRVEDALSGEATAFVWDCEQEGLYTNWKINIYQPLGPWRDGAPPIPKLELGPLGLRL